MNAPGSYSPNGMVLDHNEDQNLQKVCKLMSRTKQKMSSSIWSTFDDTFEQANLHQINHTDLVKALTPTHENVSKLSK